MKIHNIESEKIGSRKQKRFRIEDPIREAAAFFKIYLRRAKRDRGD